jgi:hypothetical protein
LFHQIVSSNCFINLFFIRFIRLSLRDPSLDLLLAFVWCLEIPFDSFGGELINHSFGYLHNFINQ